MNLSHYGWNPGFQESIEPFRALGLVPARVLAEHRDAYVVVTEAGEMPAEPMGRLLFAAAGREDLPAVGDWVAARIAPEEPRAYLHAVLPRRNRLARKEAGRGAGVQILAANVDTLFVATSLNQDLNPRRLERFLALAAEGGVEPVVLLTKSDLDPFGHGAARTAAEAVSPGVPVLVLSAASGEGLHALAPWLAPGRTVALAGSSGVGKSTLVNALLGRAAQATRAVREDDDRGRHATTARQIFVLPGGALLVDTPGLRELALPTGGGALDDAFRDVSALAADCRFRDCRHGAEPGCAVRAAVDAGALDAERLEGLAKLRREVAWLEDRASESAGLVEKRRWKRMTSGVGTDLGKRSRR